MAKYDQYIRGKETTGDVIRLNFKRDKVGYGALKKLKGKYNAQGVHLIVANLIEDYVKAIKV